MRRILRAGAGLILSFGAALAPLLAQAEQSAAVSDAAQNQADAAAQDKNADAAPAKSLIIGRDVLTHIDRQSLGSLVINWLNCRLLADDKKGYFCNKREQEPIRYLGIEEMGDPSYKIPAGKYIILPVAYALQFTGQTSDYLGPGEGEEIIHTSHGDILAADKKLNCREAMDAAAGWADDLGESNIAVAREQANSKDIMHFTLDGRDLMDFGPFRVSFNKCLKSPLRGGAPYAADGYWILLHPLAKGHHVIEVQYWESLADCDGIRRKTYEIDAQ